MMDWVVSQQGTQTGATLATMLALMSAVLHAVFGALQKGRQDPWLVRGAIDVCLVVMGLPIALLIAPWPNAFEWSLLGGALIIHFFYKLFHAMAYERGAYTVVYPIVRGGGVLFTVIGAGIIFGEVFTFWQWVGVILLVASIMSLSLYNLNTLAVDRHVMTTALGMAALTAAMVAIYTTFDAYAVRASLNPFTFLIWFFVVTGIDFPFIAWWKYRRAENPPALVPLFQRGVIGAWVAVGSFGAVIMATYLDKVGEAAVLRETSTVFAAIIGWVFLKETVGPRRLALMSFIAVGAVIVEFAG